MAEGFEEFASTNIGWMLVLARGLTRDHARAEDVVQESLIAIWGSWDRVSSARSVKAYSRKVVLRKFIRHSKRWHREDEQQVTTSMPISATDPLEQLSDRDHIAHLLDELPPRQRAVLVLRYLEDLDEAEIAACIGIRPATVRSTTARALARLRTAQRTAKQVNHE